MSKKSRVSLKGKLTDEKAIVDMIWEATDGHPNVVQRICDRLIALLNKRGTLNLYHYRSVADEVYRVPLLMVMATTNRGYLRGWC